MPPRAIRTLRPLGLQGTWGILCVKDKFSHGEEVVMVPLQDWIHCHGPAHGFRIPNVRGRARHLGMEGYLRGFAHVTETPDDYTGDG